MGDGGKVSLKLKSDSKVRLEFRGASHGGPSTVPLSCRTLGSFKRGYGVFDVLPARGSSSLDSASFISPTNEVSPTFDSD